MDPQNVVALKDYVDTRFAALQLAVDKADTQMHARLAGMNEFRDALKDQAGRLATRETVDLITTNLREDIKKVAERVGEIERKQANSEGRTWMLFTLLSIFLTVLSIVLRFVFP